MRRAGVSLANKILGASDEVFPGVRLGFLFSGQMPFYTVVAAAAHARKCHDSPALEPRQIIRSKEWLSVNNAIGSVAIQQRRIRAVAFQSSFVKNDQRNRRLVVAFYFDCFYV